MKTSGEVGTARGAAARASRRRTAQMSSSGFHHLRHEGVHLRDGMYVRSHGPAWLRRGLGFSLGHGLGHERPLRQS